MQIYIVLITLEPILLSLAMMLALLVNHFITKTESLLSFFKFVWF